MGMFTLAFIAMFSFLFAIAVVTLAMIKLSTTTAPTITTAQTNQQHPQIYSQQHQQLPAPAHQNDVYIIDIDQTELVEVDYER